MQSQAVFALALLECMLVPAPRRDRVVNKPPKLHVQMWGMSISAEGLVAVLAAVAIITLVVLATRFSL